MAFAHAQLVPPGSREIRVGGDRWTYGDPYEWCCIAKPVGAGVVELSLVTEPPTRRQAWAVVRLLRSLGYRQILVRRVVGGRERVVSHQLLGSMNRRDSKGSEPGRVRVAG
jgi:hypothetical protein